jgi:hypothetical protein
VAPSSVSRTVLGGGRDALIVLDGTAVCYMVALDAQAVRG